METNEFFKALRQELINTQDLRFKFAMQKLVYLISLFGLSSVSLILESLDIIKYLIYFIPFIAYVFDLYIIGENFGIRRIGNYLKYNENVSNDERRWEFLINMPKGGNRDIFAIYGNSYSTSLSIIISSCLILFVMDTNSDVFLNSIWFKYIWLGTVLVAFYLLRFRYIRKLEKRLLCFNISINKYSSSWDLIMKDEKDILSSGKHLKEIEKEISKLYSKDYKNFCPENTKN